MKINASNERIKHEYFALLSEAKQLSEHSVDAVAKALDRFETYTDRRDFRKFHREQAIAFKRHLADRVSARTGEPLSKGTVLTTLNALKAFFTWLATHPGYRGSVQYSDAAFFNLSLKDTAIAKAVREPRSPTIEQIRAVLAAMPFATPIERRNRALIAFTLLTGARDDAIASMQLRHVDLEERVVHQDARVVRTKFSKSFPTFFFPVGDDIEAIVADWVRYQQSELGWTPTDPLFPATKTELNAEGCFSANGLQRITWSTAAPIRAIFKSAFEAAGLPYYNPHSFRRTLTLLGLDKGLGDATMKAWSQNLGHDNIRTTLMSYGEIPTHRQRDLIRASARAGEDDAIALQLGREMLASMRAKKVA